MASRAGAEREPLLPSSGEYAENYQALRDPEAGMERAGSAGNRPPSEEAKRFRKLMKRSATAACVSGRRSPFDGSNGSGRPCKAPQSKGVELDPVRRTLLARKERERLKARRGGQGHSFWYSVVSVHSHRTEAVIFRWFIACVIMLDVICFILETDQNLERRHARFFYTVEGASSHIFLIEYLIRFAVIPENKRYMHMPPWTARLAWCRSMSALIDLVSFAPWFIEALLPLNLPNLQSLRILRLFRMFKSNSVMGSVDVIARVLYYNGEILCVAFMIDVILVLLMSTILYYLAPPPDTPGLEDSFNSIPATMYLSVMMLTGQGQPAGQLPWYTKVIVVATAILATAQFAIPASMLTWGFEQEAERRINKNHELREKQKERMLKGEAAWVDAEISSTSTSESDLGHEWLEYEAVVIGSDSETEEEEQNKEGLFSRGGGLTATEAARIAKIFSILDADENGTLKTSDICQMASGKQDAEGLASMLDPDGDGKTTSEDFVHWLTKVKAKNGTVFQMIMGDLEKLRPAAKSVESTVTSLPDQLMMLADQFRELNSTVQKLRDELASKDAEIAQLKYNQQQSK